MLIHYFYRTLLKIVRIYENYDANFLQISIKEVALEYGVSNDESEM